MSSTLAPLEGEALRLASMFVVVVRADGVVIAGHEEEEDVRCGFPQLRVLERLVQADAPPVSRILDEVAEETGAAVPELRAFVEGLADRGAVRAGELASGVRSVHTDDVGIDGHQAGAAGATIEPPGRDEMLVLRTPLVLGVTAGGFTKGGNDAVPAMQLSALELAAATTYGRPTAFEGAIRAHRAEVSTALALREREFQALVVRLLACRVVTHFDPDDLSLGGGYERDAETYRRDFLGHRAVSAAIERDMARLDDEERERRAAGRTARPRIYPAHSIVAAWRNPPLSLGLIFAYAQAHDDGQLLEHFDFRPDWLIDEEKIDRYGEEPGIYLFSNYVWSSVPNLELSARVKERNPGSITVHGGPDVPKYEGDVETYFANNPHVDVTVRGEGEVTLAEMLSAIAGHLDGGPVDLSVLADVPGLSYRDGERVVRTADRDRLSDLDVLPSPYLTGLFDSYVEGWNEIAEAGAAGTDGWSYQLPVVVMETNRGCPYGCTFCDWGSATLSRIRKYSLDRIFAEIEWCGRHRVDTIGLADANFGIFERDVEITQKVADSKLTVGYPKQFGTNYAKNSVKHLKRIIDELAKADILSFGLLSLQAMDTDTLATIKRSNIKIEKYEELAVEFQKANLPLYVDLMVGLPGQTVRSFRSDLQECINREVHAKVFQTQLLVNSPMNEPSYREEHGIVSKPGQLVLESASFTRADYDEMMRVRRVFFVLEKYGLLRHVARYVRQEAGLLEIDLHELLARVTAQDPYRWPLLDFVLRSEHRFLAPPVSWADFLAEVRAVLIEEVGIADDDALDTVMAVQLALLPDRGRSFPVQLSLPHDYVAWHARHIEVKYSGHLGDWPEHAPALRTFGPGTMEIEDRRNTCELEIGRRADSNPWGAWDLESPVSRAVALQT